VTPKGAAGGALPVRRGGAPIRLDRSPGRSLKSGRRAATLPRAPSALFL
jgi:hypothetical protein